MTIRALEHTHSILWSFLYPICKKIINFKTYDPLLRFVGQQVRTAIFYSSWVSLLRFILA